MNPKKPYEAPAIVSTEPKTRKHYAPPAVLESGAFEQLVLACSHLPGICGFPAPKGTANS